MIRPMYVQLTTTIATMTVDRPGLIRPPAQPFPSEHDEAIPSASSRIGNASVTSITPRDERVDRAAVEAGDHARATTPRPTESAVATSATSSETRAP